LAGRRPNASWAFMQEALGANGAGAELQEERNEGEKEMEMAGNSSGLGRSSVVRAESAGRQVSSSQRWSGPPGCCAATAMFGYCPSPWQCSDDFLEGGTLPRVLLQRRERRHGRRHWAFCARNCTRHAASARHGLRLAALCFALCLRRSPLWSPCGAWPDSLM
jgi:hypothetical protein